MHLKLVHGDDEAPLTRNSVTPEQRALYEEAARIFGDRASRPDAPGHGVSKGPDNLSKAQAANNRARVALRLASMVAPEFLGARENVLRAAGLDPDAFPALVTPCIVPFPPTDPPAS